MTQQANYNLDTAGGMAAAKEWTTNHLNLIREGGVWLIPRSMSIYKVLHSAKQCRVLSGGDTATDRVLKAMGWEVFYEN